MDKNFGVWVRALLGCAAIAFAAQTRAQNYEPPVVFYPSGTLTCPAGEQFAYFLNSWVARGNVPQTRGASWCEAAANGLNYAQQFETVTWRLPYLVEQCVEGQYWTYSHAWQGGGRYISGPVQGIDLACKGHPLLINLSGAASTMAQNLGGQTVTLTATVTRNSVPQPGVAVSLSTSAPFVGEIGLLSGTTDSAGAVTIQYTPPLSLAGNAVDRFRADCTGCNNSRNGSIQVKGGGQTCDRKGNPIDVSSGVKTQDEKDIVDSGPHPLHLVRHYASHWSEKPPGNMGGRWSHNHAHRVFGAGTPAPSNRVVQFGDGSSIRFENTAPAGGVQARAGGSWNCAPGFWCDPDSAANSGGSTPAWTAVGTTDTMTDTAQGILVRRAADDSEWLFDAATGDVLSARQRNGWTYVYSYSNGRLAQVTNAFGRTLQFTYNADGLVASATSASGSAAYTYAGASTLPACGAGQRPYKQHFQHGGYNYITYGETPDEACLGMVGKEYAGGTWTSFTWSASLGICIGGGHPYYSANGHWFPVTQHCAYPEFRLNTAAHSGGTSRTYHYEDSRFFHALTGITDENNTRYANFGYDAKGRGVLTEHAGGAGRFTFEYGGSSTVVADPLNTQRTYLYQPLQQGAGGLGRTGTSAPEENGASIQSQTYDGNGLLTDQSDFLGVQTMYTWDINRRLPTSTTLAANRPEAKTIQTQWHPTFRLPTLITEPGRTTGFTYDSLGNVLTTTVTDTATGQSRTVTLAYNAQGLLQSVTDPLGGVAQFGYDAVGNLTSETNTLGHVTSFTHDAAGRVLTQTDPTGLVTSYTYDARGRVLTVSAAGQTTTFTYQPTGNLATASFPSGLAITYSYDAAQRPIGWADNRGAQGSYTLDASGNRTVEQLKDGNGNVIWQLQRSVNTMNRVTGTTLGANLSQSFAYNANGDLTSHTNGLNQSTSHTLDGLKRVTAITNAANATASLAYDARDNVTAATDFKGVTTTYSRNAFGEAQQEASGDPGTSATTYNALGLPTQVTDAMGQATSIQRDALGRPTQMDFQDGKITILRYDLAGSDYNTPGAPNASKGYLSEIEDRAGITKWQRDIQGRITQRSQTLKNGSTQTVSYSYNAQGLLDTLTYPGGGQLQHLYDTTGRLTGMNWNGSPLVTNITWDATGQPTAWSWAFSTPLNASRSYDTAGRLTATEISSYSYDAAGRIASLTQNLGQPADSDPNSTSVTFANTTFTVGYDAVGRITSFGDGTNSTTFTYDANGNRESSVTTGNGTTVTRSYTVDAASNRLTGFTQQIAGPNGNSATSVTYAYNANGDITSDGLRNFSFDAEGRLSSVATGSTQTSPTTRYAHSAMGERLFKTEPLQIGEEPQPGQEQNFIEQLFSFFKKLWAPQTTTAEQLGWAYAYGEGGTLLAEVGMGGAQSTGATQFVWLPTPGGAVPVAAIINGNKYAVHADHLNTPRRLTDQYGQAAWQWKFSAFGEEQPTRAAKRFVDPDKVPGMGSGAVADVTYNLRYPGQVADAESGLHYNYFRTYDPNTARYLQPDPIGLSGDWNRYLYAGGSATNETDPTGLFALRTSAEFACLRDPRFCAEIMGDMAGNAAEASRRAGDECVADGWDQIAGALHAAGAIFEFAGMRGLGKGMARSAAKGAGRKTGGAGANPDYHSGGAGPTKNSGGAQAGAGAPAAAKDTTTAIGRVKDLQNLGPGERSLLDRLPNRGNPKANWQQNAGVLREEMRRGLPIRDASPGDTAGPFLNAERNLLRDRGWTFDPKTNFWMPPKP